MDRDRGKFELDQTKVSSDLPSTESSMAVATSTNSTKVLQTVIKSLVSESYRMAQDNIKDRLAGIRHIFRV